ncbi:MAG: aminoacyl-tRNA hydrolase [Deltaproteobacteria bacterium]|nr:aminoacyl-tRNA hydrolase [Deltaproteobacteria bacterium]
MFFLIIGLGNPGEAYRKHRHNVGFWAVERLAQASRLSWTESDGPMLQAQGRIDGQQVFLVKPRTFMNLSGQAVVHAQAELGLEANRIIVLHDDLDLALGRLQVRFGGGDGGHRGVRSVVTELAPEDFSRIRMGVGRSTTDAETVDHVLSAFADKELAEAEAMAMQAAEAVRVWMREGLTIAMNRFNPWKMPKPNVDEPLINAGNEPGDEAN